MVFFVVFFLEKVSLKFTLIQKFNLGFNVGSNL